MRKQQLMRFGMILLLVVAATFGARPVAGAEEHVALKDVPEALRGVIEKATTGGEIKEIEKETEEGEISYSVEFVMNGKEYELEVSAEEDLREQEQEIQFGDAPAAVQAAVKKHAGANAITKMEKETEEGRVSYEAEYLVNGVEHSISMTDLGELLALEQHIDPATLPKAALDEVKKDYPDAKIEAAESVQIFFYELELLVKGQKREITVFATGDIEDEYGDEGHGEQRGHDADDDDNDQQGEKKD